jgi:hypothetical protein
MRVHSGRSAVCSSRTQVRRHPLYHMPGDGSGFVAGSREEVSPAISISPK